MNNMSNDDSKKTLITITIAVIIFVTAIAVPRILGLGGAFLLSATQVLEFFLALLAISILGKNRFVDYGFRKPVVAYFGNSYRFRFFLLGFTALSLGAITSLIMMSSGASGNLLIKQLSFPRMILHIWIISSIVEEIFTRGFLQSHLIFLSGIKIKLFFLEIDLPTLISALFFGSMHFVLLLSGADILTIAIIFVFTFSLGLLAGHQRILSGSLLPPILLHFLANFGAFVGGVFYVIATMIMTGRMPVLH